MFKNLIFVCSLVLMFGKISQAQTTQIYVSPTGNNTGTGLNVNDPVSLNRAKQLVKTQPTTAFKVWLADGNYSSGLVLDASDSRNAAYSVSYIAQNKGKALFSTKTSINRSSFLPLPLDIKNRIIDANAKENVVMLSLTSYNLTSLKPWANQISLLTGPSAQSSTPTYPLLFLNDSILPLSQYPNGSMNRMTMSTILSNGVGASTTNVGIFTYKNDGRHNKWLGAVQDGLWLFGFWRVSWGGIYIQTATIDTIQKTVTQAIGISNGIGDKYSPVKTINGMTARIGNGKEPYWAVNLVEEIDMEGEYSVDFNKKVMYLWPPKNGNLFIGDNSNSACLSIVGVNYTSFEKLGFNGLPGSAITLNKCNYITIAGNNFSNIARNVVNMVNCQNSLVLSNDFTDMGYGGVFMQTNITTLTSDLKTLKKCNNRIINNYFGRFSKINPVYTPAISIGNTIGAYVGNNLIHTTPHEGVDFGNNEHILEYNEIYDVVNNSSDMAAFYSYRNDMQGGGTKIRHNFIHDTKTAGIGIFWDGGVSGVAGASGDSTYYNIITRTFSAIQNNGGYMNTVQNSIFGQSSFSYFGNTVSKTSLVSTTTSFLNLKSFYANNPGYSATYPRLNAFFQPVIDESRGSTIYTNYTCSALVSTTGIKYITDGNLFKADGSPTSTAGLNIFNVHKIGFSDIYKIVKPVSSTAGTFLDSLKSNGAFSKTCGQNWQISRIGLYKDQYRTDISQTMTKGKAPNIALTVLGQCLSAPADITLIAEISNPNIKNCMSGFAFYANGQSISGLVMTVTNFGTNDLVQCKAVWKNVPAGYYAIQGYVFDAPNFEFASPSTILQVGNLPLTIGGISMPNAMSNGQITQIFKVNPVLGVTNFQWKTPNEMSIISGQGTNVVTTSLTSCFTNGTISVTGFSNCNTLNTSTLNAFRVTNAWIGTVSTAWNNTSNWCGGVPSSNSEVLINKGVYQPEIITTVGIKNLWLANQSELTVSGIFSLKGNFVNNGNIYAASGSTVSLTGNSLQSISGTNASTFDKLTINNTIGVSLAQDISIKNYLLLGNAARITTTGYHLTLISNSITGLTASIATIPTNAYFEGNKVVVERFIPAKKTNRFLSSPVNNATAQQLQQKIVVSGLKNGSLNGFDATQYLIYGNIPSIKSYAESVTGSLNNGFTSIPSVTSPFEVGKGYQVFIRGDRFNVNSYANSSSAVKSASSDVVLTFAGVINQGTIDVPLTYTPTSNLTNDGWNLIGNPYPSEITFDNFSFEPGVTPALYLWDPLTTNTTYVTTSTGRYFTFSPPGICSPNTPNCGVISSSQGFFVKTSQNAKIRFTELMKVNGSKSMNLFRTSSISNHLVIDLNPDDEINGLNDQTHLFFQDESANQYDPSDALKLLNSNGVNIYSTCEEGYALVFNKLGNVVNQIKSIPLVINNNSSKGQLKFTGLNSFEENVLVRFQDKKLQIDTILTDNFIYDFDFDKTDTTSTSPRRFSIMVQPKFVGGTNSNSPNVPILTSTVSLNETKDFAIYPNPNEGSFTILSKSIIPYNIITLEGNVLIRGILNEGKNNLVSHLEKGFYLIKIGNNTFKLLVE